MLKCSPDFLPIRIGNMVKIHKMYVLYHVMYDKTNQTVSYISMWRYFVQYVLLIKLENTIVIIDLLKHENS